MCSAGLFSLRTVDVSWGVCSAPGVWRLSLRIIHEPSTLLSSEIECTGKSWDKLQKERRPFVCSRLLTFNAFLVQRRSTLLAPYWTSLAAWAWYDGHVVLISSGQQAVPVGDQRQPYILPLLWHRLWHKLLQVRVTKDTSSQLNHHHHHIYEHGDWKKDGSTYTVFLSWRINLEENSLRTSRKAKLVGGNSGPRGFWYLNANSIPSLIKKKKHN